MNSRKEEEPIRPSIALNHTSSPNNPSEASFYQWLASRSAFIVIGAVPENEAPEDISDLRPASPLKEGVRRMPFHRKRKSEGGLETSHSSSKKQTPPASPKLPIRKPSPLLFPSSKGTNLESSPSEISLDNDNSLSPREQELLDALLKKLKGKPTHLLIAEKAIAQQRILDQQQPSQIVTGSHYP
jgi:hypothetical protein